MPLLPAGSHLFNSSVEQKQVDGAGQAVSALPTFALFIPDCLFLCVSSPSLDIFVFPVLSPAR